jgi:hypothetical protein
LTPELRASVEKVCRQSASLSETILAVKNSLVMAKATLARAEGRPHRAALRSVQRREEPSGNFFAVRGFVGQGET